MINILTRIFRKPLVEMFQGKDGWRVRIKSKNGEIRLSSEAYSSKANATRAARALAADLGVEVSEPKE